LAKIAVLTGNGLSIALNSEFSISVITEKFFNRLKPEHKAFVEHHISDHTNKSNFEECIATIETFYDALHDHLDFFSDGLYGNRFTVDHGVNLTEIKKHEQSIRASIDLYMALIVEIIDRNVKMYKIQEKLPNFVKWITSIISANNEVDLFTLNYDLLLETILLSLDSVQFMEFYDHAGPWFAISDDRSISKNIYRHFFNPKKAMKKRKNYRTKLYHLHGSLSSFKDLKNKKIFKVKTETIRKHNVYNRITELNIVPSIITGGRKNDKIQEEPFHFYYTELLTKMSNEDHICDELYIIGYSFSDDHINRAISERLNIANRSVNPRPVKIVIVDYASTAEDKAQFIELINDALGLEEGANLRFFENDQRVLFGGANSIQAIVQIK
jgi:hypothetical protein